MMARAIGFDVTRAWRGASAAYNPLMSTPLFDEMAEYIGFDSHDVANLRALAPIARPLFAPAVDRFYSRILAHDATRGVLKSPEQAQRLRQTLLVWLESLFCGEYDAAYVHRHAEIGRVHVRVGLPQEYMLTAMEIMWDSLSSGLRAARAPEAEDRLRSLHKLLTLELGLMLDGYRGSYIERVRQTDREVMHDELRHIDHLAQIGQLAAALAHEIKNPLAGISGAIQVIRDGLSAADARRPVLNEVLRQIARLDGTVKDLLVYARPRSPNRNTCRVDQTVQRVLTVLRDEPESHRVRIDARGCDRPFVLRVDEAQFEQMLLNLLQNAINASPDGGVVRVELADADGFATVTVADEGCGMTPETCERAFEPFFTLKSRGTGLGLPICRRIVESHGGSITLSSVVGRGTEVVVRLPHER